ncbi:MAG: HlyD family efflux transporter periplasmic adaptor subunit [Dysgonamonadaceae bacterium]
MSQENQEFKSQPVQEVLGSVPHWILRFGILIVSIIIILIIVGSAIFKYPDVVKASMSLISTTPPITLKAKNSGKIKNLTIADKQRIPQNTYLATIENPARLEDVLYLKNYLNCLAQNKMYLDSLPRKDLIIGDLQSLYANYYTDLIKYQNFNSLDYYKSKISISERKIREYADLHSRQSKQLTFVYEKKQLALNQYKRDSLLNRRGIISDEDLELSRSKVLDITLNILNMEVNLQSSTMQTSNLKETLIDNEYQYLDKKSELEVQLRTDIDQLNMAIRKWENDYVFKSPIEGIVVFTNFWKENQNVQAEEDVFNIIPIEGGKLIGKATMPMDGSGKVKIGQKVNVHFLNFPDHEFGMVKGLVHNISLVPAKDADGKFNYIVEIIFPEGLKTTYNKYLPYLPEMQAEVDIITDDITLLERVFLPLRKLWSQSQAD